MEFRNNTNTSDDLPVWIILLDVLQVTLDIVAVIVGVVFVSVIIIDKLYTRVSLVLAANSCLVELLFSICMCSMNTLTLYYDIKKINSSDWFCMLLGYLSFTTVGLQYYTYLLQAMYRYILAIYPT